MPDTETAPGRSLESELRGEREALLRNVHEVLDGFMVALSIAWIALVVVELAAGGLPPSLEVAVWAIWAVFLVDFVIEFVIAPGKGTYLRTHWLSVISLVLPAFRIVRIVAALRVLRAARLIRTVGLLRVLTSTNRGLASLRATAARRGVPYVLSATAIVIAVGAAGMAYFEVPQAQPTGDVARSTPIRNYGDAIWWTAYAMTTGATSQPASAEGRLLGWLLSLYGLGVFGYLTAILASHFVGQVRQDTLVGHAPTGPATGPETLTPNTGQPVSRQPSSRR